VSVGVGEVAAVHVALLLHRRVGRNASMNSTSMTKMSSTVDA